MKTTIPAAAFLLAILLIPTIASIMPMLSKSLEAQAVVGQPEISVSKWIIDGSTLRKNIGVDAWDRVDFMINVTNTGNAAAFDLTFNDSINALDPKIWARNLSVTAVYLTNGTHTTSLTSGVHYNLYISPNTSYPYWMNLTLLVALDINWSLIVNFTVYIHGKVITGSVYKNKVEVTRYSSSSGGSNLVDPANPPSDSVNVKTLNARVFRKLVVWSSEDFTGRVYSGVSEPKVVTIGEEIIYELRVRIPEGVTLNLTVMDTLPLTSGVLQVEYLGDANITVDDAGVTATNATLTPSTWNTINGTTEPPNILRFYIGNVTNTNNDTDREIIRIRFRVAVLDEPVNFGGVEPENQGLVRFTRANGALFTQPVAASVNVTIHEPDLVINKTATPSTINNTNPTSTIVIMVENRNTTYSSPAFDLVLQDIVPSDLEVVSASESSLDATGVSLSVSGNNVTLTADSLEVGGYINLTITVRAHKDTIINSTINNTATLTASSLPGNVTGERIYNLSDWATIRYTAKLIVEKLVDDIIPDLYTPSTSIEIPPGGIAVYIINVTLPLGTIPELNITEALDPDVSLIPPPTVYTYTLSDISIDSVSFSPPATVVMNNVSINDTWITIIVRFIVQVSNTTVAGDTILNNANVTTLDGSNNTNLFRTNTATLTIVEPDLRLTKTIDPPIINNTAPTSTFTIRIDNINSTYSSIAYDIKLKDNVPSELQILGISVSSSGATGITTAIVGNTVYLNASSLNPGGWIILNITVTAYMDTPINGTFNNTVSMKASSLPGDVEGEKLYRLGDWAQITYIAPYDIEKLVDDIFTDTQPPGALITLPPGGIAQFTINITLPLGTLPELNVTDMLNPVFTIDTLSVTIIKGPDVYVASQTINSYTPLDISFTNVSVNRTWSYIIISYEIQLSNSTYDGLIVSNNASATSKDAIDDVFTRYALAYIQVVEPDLTLTKYFDPPVIFHYDVYSNMTLAISNDGTSPAYDVVFTDIVPDTILVEDVQVVSLIGVSGFTLLWSGNNITLTADSIASGGYIELRVLVRAYAGTPWNSTTNNTATVEYSSLPGDVEGEKLYSGSVWATVFYDPILEGIKYMEPAEPDRLFPGDLVRVIINVTIPTGYSDNITIVDTFDRGMSLALGPFISHPPDITTDPPVVNIVSRTLTIYLGRVANNATIPLNITIELYLRIDRIPVVNGTPDNVYWNNASIFWLDKGFNLTRNLGSDTLVVLPLPVGGEANILVGKSSYYWKLAVLVIGLASVIALRQYNIIKRR